MEFRQYTVETQEGQVVAITSEQQHMDRIEALQNWLHLNADAGITEGLEEVRAELARLLEPVSSELVQIVCTTTEYDLDTARAVASRSCAYRADSPELAAACKELENAGITYVVEYI